MPLDSLTTLFTQAASVFTVVFALAYLMGEVVRWVYTDIFGRITNDD